MKIRAYVVLLMVLAGATTACNLAQRAVDGGGAQACTDIGCQSQVTVTMQGVELTDGAGVVRTRMCFDEDCQKQRTKFTADGASFGRQGSRVEVYILDGELHATLRLPEREYDDTTKHNVTLEVRIEGAKPLMVEREVTLVRGQPNGPDCEPVCWQAIINA